MRVKEIHVCLVVWLLLTTSLCIVGCDSNGSDSTYDRTGPFDLTEVDGDDVPVYVGDFVTAGRDPVRIEIAAATMDLSDPTTLEWIGVTNVDDGRSTELESRTYTIAGDELLFGSVRFEYLRDTQNNPVGVISCNEGHFQSKGIELKCLVNLNEQVDEPDIALLLEPR